MQLNLPEVEDQVETGPDIEAEAAAHDLPVLYPEGEEEEGEFPDEDAVAEAVERAQAIENIPELNPEVEEDESAEDEAEALDEELVVNKWPDPLG